ncbi:unnamed protein product [Staurois parvus]|uniref:Uncharacterized protein n=2 Tax=Staurois parvus TaxID=386267 RepID=A0ABN9C172_9NEOB|nr:unnamed protein product [Staurois parvus]
MDTNLQQAILNLESMNNLQSLRLSILHIYMQGRTDHLETRALPEGPGSVGGPMRCPWYLFHRLF